MSGITKKESAIMTAFWTLNIEKQSSDTPGHALN